MHLCLARGFGCFGGESLLCFRGYEALLGSFSAANVTLLVSSMDDCHMYQEVKTVAISL